LISGASLARLLGSTAASGGSGVNRRVLLCPALALSLRVHEVEYIRKVKELSLDTSKGHHTVGDVAS
jgi:hypothetical protein